LFWWQKDNAGAASMATEQALLALATVEHGQSPFISMKNELEIPELPEKPEEPKETILPFNKEVPAHSKEVFEIADTQNTLTMPSNLPENTTIKVTDVTTQTANKEVPVHIKEKLVHADTQITLNMTSNLPENTIIKVKDVTKETDLVDNNLSIAGKILSFTLNNKASNEDPFVLTMSINEN